VFLFPVGVYQAAAMALELHSQRAKFFCSFWQWVRLALTALTWSSIVIFAVMATRDVSVYSQLAWSHNRPEHVSLFPLTDLHATWRNVLAMALFLLVILVRFFCS
jgi:hypothetical protein